MKLFINLALLAHVLAAPIDDPKEVSKRRESTQETIELENTLKRLAGENKKYFSSTNARPVPQVDGLEERGSGDEDEITEDDQKAPVPIKPLEEQLQEQQQAEKDTEPVLAENEDDQPNVDEALEDEIYAAQYPIPGPYGPGFDSNEPGRSLEFEPRYVGEDEDRDEMLDEEEQEEPEEEYFLEKVMETLRRHPELISELIHQEHASKTPDKFDNVIDNMPGNDIEERNLKSLADYDDQLNEIQQELLATRAESDPEFAAAYQKSLANAEKEQVYSGDNESHIVAKKKSVGNSAIPREYVEDNMDSLNRYFNAYADEDLKRSDVPIM